MAHILIDTWNLRSIADLLDHLAEEVVELADAFEQLNVPPSQRPLALEKVALELGDVLGLLTFLSAHLLSMGLKPGLVVSRWSNKQLSRGRYKYTLELTRSFRCQLKEAESLLRVYQQNHG